MKVIGNRADAPFPPFNPYVVRCIKCNLTQMPYVRYQEAECSSPDCTSKNCRAECLIRSCSRCKYTWVESVVNETTS